MKRAGGALAALALLGAAPAGGDVSVSVTGLRSTDGMVRACLTAQPHSFPECKGDPDARELSIKASDAATIRFRGLAPGRYAIALLHDENGNGKADMMLMIPKEGFGFSRNAPVRFGPPTFKSAAFPVEGEAVSQPIQMRYMF